MLWKTTMLIVVVCCISGCAAARQNRNLCNSLYCNPDLEGRTAEEVRDEFGDPDIVTRSDGTETWTYEVNSLWRFGSQGMVRVFFEDGFVTDTVFRHRDPYEEDRVGMDGPVPVGTYPNKPTIGE